MSYSHYNTLVLFSRLVDSFSAPCTYGGEAMDVLVSVEEAAKLLGGLSKWTIYAWLSQGRLRRVKVGSRTMIRESELQKVIQDGGKSPAPRPALQESANSSI